jgi:hypothetical protein
VVRIAEHTFSRTKVSLYSILVGFLIGLFNSFFPLIDFTLSPALFGWMGAAIIAVVVLHEGTHAGVAHSFGCNPVFGLKPPLVYVTFPEKIPRGQFIAVALAPLIVLDIVFAVLFGAGILKTFSFFCFMINTLGAVGDIWMTVKLLPYEKGTLVKDTKTGIEVWRAE